LGYALGFHFKTPFREELFRLQLLLVSMVENSRALSRDSPDLDFYTAIQKNIGFAQRAVNFLRGL